MRKSRRQILIEFNRSVIALSLLLLAGCGGHKESYKEVINASDWGSEMLAQDPEDLYKVEDPTPEKEATDTPTDSIEVAAAPATPAVSAESKPTVATPVPQPTAPTRAILGPGNLAEVFNDSNHCQMNHARRLGIRPITDLASYYNTSRPIVKVATNEDFVVAPLTHSYPYLVPEAADLLHVIGRNFRDSVKSKGLGDYRIVATSLLRTPNTVKMLRRVNGNATEQSTHQYATTFDISYSTFNLASGPNIANQEQLKLILGEVLRDLRRQNRCMVKYEIKSPCFHITATQ